MKLECKDCMLGAPINECFQTQCNSYKEHQETHKKFIQLLLQCLKDDNYETERNN